MTTATTNRERVGRVLEALRQGLGPYVLSSYKQAYGAGGYLRAIESTLSYGASGVPSNAVLDEETMLKALDVHRLLILMWDAWNDAFQSKLGHPGRNYVSELREVRNRWAHQQPFSNEQATRAADTAELLLRAVGASEQAQAVQAISHDLLRIRFERETERARQETAKQASTSATPRGLTPWRDVISPHSDVAGGRYIQAEFAADIAQVHAKTAEPEYQEPVAFFERTYLTEGLLSVLANGVRRLTAQGGDPVVQLQTVFGGGKTHSMLALYHLAGKGLELRDIRGGERIAEEVGNVDMPEANRAVIVGTAFSPTNPTAHADVSTRTLWGEIAYQLGRAEGYALVEQADRKGVNPGSNVILQLLEDHGPCLIIVDELVAYVRNLYRVEGLPAGSFDTVMSFIQSLTEAVRRSTDSMMLISLPESNIEIGGEAGQAALEHLSHIVGRIESVWKPISAQEGFEIVRRRLFADDIKHAQRDAVIEAFAAMYRQNKGEFPGGVSERDYIDRMRAAYPIHPELFDRLYEDWSTLDRFQRTRGVLRLMAAIIHQLWVRNDASALIMPGTLPLDATPVRNELLRYLPDTWAAVMDVDIDGQESRPYRLDGDVPNLGKHQACRRVARTVFIGSAPSVAGQRIRGLEEVRIRLGAAQPSEPTAVFGDALRRMGAELTYLYTDGSRYWYDTRPTVNKLGRDRAQSFGEDVVENEIIARLRSVSRTRDFAGFHVVPPENSDVADDDRVRIVVLHPRDAHRRTTGETEAVQEALRILQKRGNTQRLYKNMLVFVGADANDVEALRTATRDYLAWRSIADEDESLNLDAQQRRQVATSLAKADETVDLRVRTSYSWLLTPVQLDPLGPITLQASRISGDDNIYERAARKLRNDALVIDTWSPDNLRMELDRYFWDGDKDPQIGLRRLWECLAQYVYLPRLTDQQVLLEAVQDGVGRLDAPIAYATGVDAKGHHTGLVYQRAGRVYFDDNCLLVHPEHIQRPEPVEPKPPIDGKGGGDGGNGGGSGGGGTIDPRPPSKPKTRRYYGRVVVDAARVNREIGVIVEEIIERLTSLEGCDVSVTVEIGARNEQGFDESTIRTISENSRTLKFEGYGFEE